MQLDRHPAAAAAARAVAAEIAALVRADGRVVLGVAAGRTPIPVYAELARLHRDEGLSFARCEIFALDEYEGLADGAPGTFRRQLSAALFDRLDLPPGAAHLPPTGPGTDPETYDARIADAGGIDLQLLGLGGNGHIAFNEPGSGPTSPTRRVALAEATRRANASSFVSEAAVPTHAVTMGVRTILAARRVRLLAWGAHKASIVARLLASHPTPDLPASFLHAHPDARLVVDEAALSG